MSDCIVAFNLVGAGVALYDATLSCCDLFGNQGGDWVGPIGGQYGTNGNISADPLFCDPGGHDFGLQDGSPCAGHTPQAPNCDRMGSWPVGCQASQVENLSFSPTHDVRVTPNPTTGPCRIAFSASRSGPVEVELYDAQGRRVRRLLQGWSPGGAQSVVWDGRGETGGGVAAGIYLARVSGAAGSSTAHVVITR